MRRRYGVNSFANLQSRIERSESERGAILVMTALVMLLLLFVAAFATDLGAWYRQGGEQQRAADVGSLNGVAAFDRETKAYFADLPGGPVDTWAELLARPDGQNLVREAEEQGFRAAVATVQTLLETSNLTFTNPPVFVFATDPTGSDGNLLDINSTSTATLTADDGSVITITRAFVDTSNATTGTNSFTRVIEVSIERSGEQYFSDIIRDAPTIDRGAQALLSNCGALCNQPITLNPPFIGFGGSGNGDGFAPLLYDRDPDPNPEIKDYDEVWAVNHHSDGRMWGQIICQRVDVDPEINGTDCDGAPYELEFQTGNRPVEYISPAGKLYFSGRDPDAGMTGLVCFDANTKDYCSGTSFIPLFEQPTDAWWSAWINIHGPFENNGRLYVFSQDGYGACVTLAMQRCGAPTALLAGLGTPENPDPRLPERDGERFHVSNGEQIGDTLVLTQNTDTGVFFHCLNLASGNGEIGSCGAPIFSDTLGNGGDNLTFTRYNTNAQPIGVCVFNINSGNNNCVSTVSWGNAGPLPGLTEGLSELGERWGGDTLSWKGVRTFFAGGFSNLVGCWNWQTQSACTDGPDEGGAYLRTDDGITDNLGNALPYGFAVVADRCIIGLGDQAVFFSFNPLGLGPCNDAAISDRIDPCQCTDGSGRERYGVIRLPSNILAISETAFATITVGEFGPPLVDLDGVPLENIALHENGGVIDLTNIPDNPGDLWITLQVNARIVNGRSVFTEPVVGNLEIDVQPTLTQ